MRENGRNGNFTLSSVGSISLWILGSSSGSFWVEFPKKKWNTQNLIVKHHFLSLNTFLFGIYRYTSRIIYHSKRRKKYHRHQQETYNTVLKNIIYVLGSDRLIICVFKYFKIVSFVEIPFDASPRALDSVPWRPHNFRRGIRAAHIASSWCICFGTRNLH